MNESRKRLACIANGSLDLLKALRGGEVGAAQFDRKSFLVSRSFQFISSLLIADVVGGYRRPCPRKAQRNRTANTSSAARYEHPS